MRQLKITRQLTNRDSKSIILYLQDVSKVKTISYEEEVELAKRAKAGDAEAMHALINANLRFVISVAKQYVGHGLTLDELIIEGNNGLIQAVEHFDETKGFKFISYAVWWIRQAIIQAISEYSKFFRLPLNKMSSMHRMQNVEALLEHRLGRKPTIEEIAKEMDTPIETVKMIKRFQNKHTSLDAPLEEDENSTLYSVLEDPASEKPENSVKNRFLRKEIKAILQMLTKDEQKVLIMLFGLDSKNGLAKSVEEVAAIMNLTPERVRQIKDNAIKKLKNSGLQHFLSVIYEESDYYE